MAESGASINWAFDCKAYGTGEILLVTVGYRELP